MKALFLPARFPKAGLIFALGVTFALSVSAQGTFGTVNFNNKVTADNINAPVYDLVVGGTMLSGSNYLAQLYTGPVGTTEDKLVPTGAIVDFRTGVAVGYVNVGADGSRTIPNVVPGDFAVVQVRAWTAATGSTYEQAVANGTPTSKVGKSSTLIVQTKASALDIPVNMIGLQSFALTPVPEPDSMWLGTIGLALLALRFRFGEDSKS